MNGKARIFVIDDETDLAEICSMVLAAAGHGVRIWNPAAPLFEAIRAWRPQLILLDWVLGEVSGDKVLAGVRSDPLLHDTLVLAMSGLQNVEPLALRLSADGFIAKPFQPRELLNAVDACLSSGSRTQRIRPSL